MAKTHTRDDRLQRIAIRTVTQRTGIFNRSPLRTEIFDVDSGEVLSASVDKETEVLRYRNFLSSDFPHFVPADPGDIAKYPPVDHPPVGMMED